MQTNLGYFMIINCDSFSHCHLTKVFFAIHVVAKKLIEKFYHSVSRIDNAVTDTFLSIVKMVLLFFLERLHKVFDSHL